MRTAERIRVSLAGHLVVEVGATAADGAALGPLGAMALAYLVTERHRPVARDELAEVLWGEDLPATWEASLRSVMSRVRRRLQAAGVAGETIVGGRGCYQLQLPADAVVDVEAAVRDTEEASEALGRGDWERAQDRAEAAAEVAGRGFLPGLGGLWVERRQADLDEVRVRALETLSAAASAGGDHAAAVDAAEAAIAVQPLRESAHVRVMAAHTGAGNRAEALRAYERCRVILAEELGASPSERTQAAYLALLSDEAPTPAPTPPTNVRPELSSFVGREEDIRQVTKLLAANRLVTLVGPGGVGKTRLAARVGTELLGDFGDGVWLVELAGLGAASLVAQHVLAALGLSEEAGATSAESLLSHLSQRQLLLIVDNCEHLSSACAALIKDLLGGCPALVVLATSREALGLPGETLWSVPPLSLPAPSDAEPDGIWASDSVRLFVERASAVETEFALTATTAPAVADICRRLDGLPLAIELAAARIRSLSAAEIAAHLHDRFRLLVGRDPTAPERHQTLRAAIDWSFEALAEAEQRLFCRVAVFAGGFTLEAAAQVGVAHAGELDVLEALSGLVDKSLVIADRSDLATRYRVLETLRQYGAERLNEAGEETAVRKRHVAWIRSLAETAQAELETADQRTWLRRLDAEEDNVRAALDWSKGHPGGDDALRAAGALWRYWQVRGRFDEGTRWLRALLDLTEDASPEVRAKAFGSAAVLLLARSQDSFAPGEAATVRSLFEECLAIRRALGDRRGMASALHGLGGVHVRNREGHEARVCFEETLAIGRELGEKRLVAASLTNLAAVSANAANSELAAGLDARALYEESLALWRDLGDEFATARALGDLAMIAIREGAVGTARGLLTESMSIHRRLDNGRGVIACMNQLANMARRRGDWLEARPLLEESLAIGRELDDPLVEVRALVELADVSCAAGELSEAKHLYEEAVAIGRTLGSCWPLCEAFQGLGLVALMRDDVPDARRRFDEAVVVAGATGDRPSDSPWFSVHLGVLALAEGDRSEATEMCRNVLKARTRPDGVRPYPLATMLDLLAVLAASADRYERVASLIGAADGTRRSDDFAPFRVRPEFERTLAAAHHVLGDAGFESARAAGQALAYLDVLALADSMLT